MMPSGRCAGHWSAARGGRTRGGSTPRRGWRRPGRCSGSSWRNCRSERMEGEESVREGARGAGEVDAEGCDCVNEVRGAGNFEVDDGRGPRCILVCGPDFYGILGPTPKERRRMQRRAEGKQAPPGRINKLPRAGPLPRLSVSAWEILAPDPISVDPEAAPPRAAAGRRWIPGSGWVWHPGWVRFGWRGRRSIGPWPGSPTRRRAAGLPA